MAEDHEMKMVLLFDFDKTIIESDSDDWVIQNLGLTQLFDRLLTSMPYNSLMDRMMEELHLQGATIEKIAECLREVPLSPNIISAIKSAYAFGCDLKILSDANTFFIETILKHHGVLHCFSEINTNSAFVNEDGRLEILPFHDFNSSSHGCDLCPPNLCKGLIIERIQEASSTLKKRFIYIGDGKNDFCPTLKLTPSDYVMPKKHFPLWEAICSNPQLIKAGVHEWNHGEELQRNLINLITSLITKDNHNLISEEFLLADCKSENGPISGPGSFQKTVQIPH